MMHRISIVVLSLLLAMVSSTGVIAQSNPACAQDIYVQPGDSLSAIAARSLASPSDYPAIVDATNQVSAEDNSYPTITNPAQISVGWKLCIPVESASGASVPSTGGEPSADRMPTSADTASTDNGDAVNEPDDEEDVPWVVDLAPGELHPLAIERMRQASYPGSELVVEQTLAAGSNYDRMIVSYQSDGNKNYALLTIPQGEAPESGWPVIVFNHGYIPPAQYRTTERYIAYVDGFARNGYMVLRPDYRGHGFSEGEPTGGYSTPHYTIDVLNAVASVRQHPLADPARMGMWGHSMGGQIALRSMVTTDDIKAGVIWAGVVASYPDIVFNWHRQDRYPIPASIPRRALRWRTDFIETFGSPEENPEFWASISPNSYVADLSGPIQLHHGTSDTSVPEDFSELLAAEIDAVGGEVELYLYEGDDHNLAGQFGAAMQRSIAFFDEYVK